MSSPSPTNGVEQSLPVEGFLKTVLRSGLLSSEQLQVALRATPPERLKDAKYLANYLIKLGKLSRFQANKMLQGVTKGLVLGPFHVLAPIGKGGMGVVYLARDSRDQRLVAVKALPPKRAKAEERMLARFRREMDICQCVSHPNVARTYEVGVEDDVNFIAMEYIPGRNLFKLVNEEGILPVDRAARLFKEICLGLEHAHEQGLIHRDLKPSNIVITPDDHAKVLDLGLALIQGEVQEDRTVVGGQGYIVGTLDYLAPEQADDAFAVDPRSDIYSLGCTLYFALTKQPPFPGGNALQKLLRHRCDRATPVEQINPDVPPALAALVERMLAKRKEERFATVAEVRAALAPWLPEAPPAPVETVRPVPPPAETTAPAPSTSKSPAPAKPAAKSPAPAKPAAKPASPAAKPPAPSKPAVKSQAPATLPAKSPAPADSADFVFKKKATLDPRTIPAPPIPAPPVSAVQAPAPSPAPKPAKANSWFVELARQVEPPQAIPLTSADAVPAVPPPVAVLVTGPNRLLSLPFWLDYLLPIGAAALFLVVLWCIGLGWLLSK